MLRINNIRINLNEKDYINKVSSLINVPKKAIRDLKLVKQSIDARKKNDVHFICSFEFNVENEEAILKTYYRLDISRVKKYEYPLLKQIEETIMVVGSGPSGLFCAYNLARSGNKVILVERGQPVEQRTKDINELFKHHKLNPESNVQFGEGGAGTFSDGKLTTGKKDFRKQFILETFIKHGAKEDIGYLSKPHIGTDYLIKIMKSMRSYLIDQGVIIKFNTRLDDLVVENNLVKEVILNSNNKKETIKVDKLVLAIGHSARDTYQMLSKYLKMQAKPFAVGFRIEHLQEFIDKNQYGKAFKHPALKAADYKLTTQTSMKKGVYSFCMCPGGKVINASSEEGFLAVNGMSNYARNEKNANSAIIVTVNQNDFDFSNPLNGIDFQRELEKKAFVLGGSNYCVPVQRVEDYLNNSLLEEECLVKPSVLPGYKFANLNTILPTAINNALHEGLELMAKKIPGFTQNAILSGVESRSSAPLRIERDENMQSSIVNVYPIGEGAGYAGGIMSSAIDGLKCSEAICEK